MESQKKHIKFMAQKYLDSSQKETPQTSLICKRQVQSSRVHRGTESRGTPLFPDIYGGKKNKEKAQGRLQFVLNTDSPGPAAYSPPTMACRETIAPSYTFGWKTPPREGGGRRAWQKSWFMSKNPFWRKVDFNTETNWPSPSQYGQLLGTKLGTLSNTPNFTFGQRGEYCLTKKGILDEPGPNQYNIDRAYTLVLHRPPSIIINPAPLTLYKWIEKEETPGPGAYNVDKGYNARLPKCPSFYIQGVRRPKKHETGPFSTL
ncbi:protein STPG3 [Pantherophis guttatus]|uniref:Protein STPG3 n=1 Tax=Pantherophis guttatus TaxID=94885 RepID=A0ABM3YWS2_PANGU|nr:protein STPG3 [Pantherophis guttatus]